MASADFATLGGNTVAQADTGDGRVDFSAVLAGSHTLVAADFLL